MTIRVLAVNAHSDLPETNQLIGLHRAGIELTVLRFADSPHASLLDEAGVPNYTLEMNSRWDKQATRALRQRLIDTRTDILHMFSARAVHNGLRASKGLDVKLVAYRGIEGVEKVHDPISWLTFLNPRIDKIICVADAIRKYYLTLRLPWWRFPENKAITIHKGHDVDWYAQPPLSRAELELPDDAVVVACTVNDRPRKGLSYFIEAGKLLSDIPNLYFVLVGNIDADKLANTLEATGMQDRIRFTGFRNDVPQLLAACDICILPAYKREGLPRGVIEGMVNAVTPIVADAGGSPELIEQGVSGLIFEPKSSQAIADAIRWLCEHPEQRKKMGIAARERIQEHFHVAETIRKTLDVYKEITGKQL